MSSSTALIRPGARGRGRVGGSPGSAQSSARDVERGGGRVGRCRHGVGDGDDGLADRPVGTGGDESDLGRALRDVHRERRRRVRSATGAPFAVSAGGAVGQAAERADEPGHRRGDRRRDHHLRTVDAPGPGARLASIPADRRAAEGEHAPADGDDAAAERRSHDRRGPRRRGGFVHSTERSSGARRDPTGVSVRMTRFMTPTAACRPPRHSTALPGVSADRGRPGTPRPRRGRGCGASAAGRARCPIGSVALPSRRSSTATTPRSVDVRISRPDAWASIIAARGMSIVLNAAAADRLAPRRQQRIVRARERQAVDDDEAERPPGHVDALEEPGRGEHARRLVGGEAGDERRLGQVALGEDRHVDTLADRGGGEVHRLPAREQRQRPPAGGGDQARPARRARRRGSAPTAGRAGASRSTATPGARSRTGCRRRRSPCRSAGSPMRSASVGGMVALVRTAVRRSQTPSVSAGPTSSGAISRRGGSGDPET